MAWVFAPIASAGSLPATLESRWCADGTGLVEAVQPGGAAPLFSFPHRPSGAMCTAVFTFAADALHGSGEDIALAVDVSGEALGHEDAYFVAMEFLGPDGNRVGPRMFAYPASAPGRDSVQAVLPENPGMPWSSLQVLVSVRHGLAMEMGAPHAERIKAARHPLSGDARTVFDLFQHNARVGASAVDWPEAESRLGALSQFAADNADSVLTTVQNLKSMLGMTHTMAMTAGTYEQAPCPEAMTVATQSSVLKITVGPFMAMGDGACQDRYAGTSARRIVEALRKPGLREVEIDLRTNSGGTMWPMLYALRPFLAEGRLLGFAGRETHWVELQGGLLREGGTQVFPDLGVEYARSGLPVTALVCGNTTSSGEAVAIALKSSGAVLEGEPTYGFTTSNETFDLPHGVKLLLTTAAMVSPAGAIYGRVSPDVVTNAGCD